eukprot:1182410-Prorocentrum_minimum.AAC.3
MIGVSERPFGMGPPELFLHERLLASAHRTADASEADLFFVPLYTMAAGGLQVGGADWSASVSARCLPGRVPLAQPLAERGAIPRCPPKPRDGRVEFSFWVRSENVPALPASDWSIVRIYPRFLRLIGPSREYTRASCV